MMNITTEKQKDNLSKFFYDIAKINFATLVVAPFTHPGTMKTWVLASGIIATIVSFFIAFNLVSVGWAVPALLRNPKSKI